MPELSSEIWQYGLVAHNGLLAPDSPTAGQKLSIQLNLQQILKKSFNSLRQEGGSATDLPSGLFLEHHSSPKTILSVDMLARAAERFWGVLGHGCSSLCHEGGICSSPEAARSILHMAAHG